MPGRSRKPAGDTAVAGAIGNCVHVAGVLNFLRLAEIEGYKRELDTHLAVASTIATGEADVGLGIEAASRSCGLDFMLLFRERYDLILPKENYRSRVLSPLLEIITSEDFRKVVEQVGGYDISQTGLTTFFG